jgi:hypothetical protein
MKIFKFIILYLTNILLGIDHLGNTIMFGDPDETISARFGRRWPNSLFARFIDFIFFWQNNHVLNAWKNEQTESIGNEDLIK